MTQAEARNTSVTSAQEPRAIAPGGSLAPALRGFDHGIDLGMVLSILLSCFVLGPLAYPGFFYNHNGIIGAYELVSLAVSPIAGWLPSLPEAPMLSQGPFPYWLGRALLLAGLSPVAALKVCFGVAFVLGSLGVYTLARRVGRTAEDAAVGFRSVHWPALAAAAGFTVTPYVIAAVYIRGDLGEIWAIGALPLALWSALAGGRQTDEGATEPDIAAVIGGAAFWAMVGLSHLGVFVLGLLLVVFLRPGRTGLAAPISGSLIVAAVWLLLASRQRIDYSPIAPVPVDIAQIFSPYWSDALTPRDGLPVSIGPLAALGLVLGIAPIGARRPLGLVTFAVLAIALAAAWTGPLWRFVPRLFDQPYQLLGPAAIALLVAGAAVLSRLNLNRVTVGASLAVLALTAGHGNLRFQPVVPREPGFLNLAILDRDIIMLEATLTGSEPRPGGVITATMVFQNRQPIPRELTVFTHVVDSNGQVVAQHDGPPVNGRRPTLGWRVGETLVDTHRIPLPQSLPAGRYRVVAGFYDPPTGNRADVKRGSQIADHVVLAEVEIR